MKQTLYYFFFLIWGSSLSAQVITSDPELPLAEQPVTITFNAADGNGGLSGYDGEVYVHTGVLTESSTGTTDWKYVKTDWGENTPDTKLTPVQGSPDLYTLEITPDIKSYYGVPDDVKITHLAFVFRSAEPYSGQTYYEGKATGGKDIFLDVFEEGLNVSIISPEENLLETPGVEINLQAASTLESALKLFLNESLVKEINDVSISHTFNFDENGDYWIKVSANDGEEEAADSVFVHILEDQKSAPLPEGVESGINYIDENSVTLVLFAPYKEYVFAIGEFNDWTPSSEYRMNKDGNNFWITLEELEAGKIYAYQYYVDGEIKIADPYTEMILDPWNDKWIEDQTYPDLKTYPAGMTTGIVSTFQTDQEEYVWQNDFIPHEETDLVIYELLLRDFIKAHDWKTLTDTLNYFVELGVNAIELMPFNEFEGNESWGYNPSFYFAPDKYYGPEEDLKAFIDSCHGRDIAVIMDIVLNHSYGQSPLVQLYWNEELNRPAANNPWYNETSPNPVFSWGYDFDHESEYTKDFVDRVNQYWLKEYNIDGYRFDFTKGFTNTPGDGGAYDASRIQILKRMADQIWEVDSSTYVILEHFAPNAEEKDLAEYGMMIWGNLNYNYNEATMGYNESGKSDFKGVSYQEREWEVPHLVGYMESHDEERLMYKNLEYGNSSGDYDITEVETALFRVELAAAFFFTVPGPKMIWQFGEMGYDFSIDYNGRVGNKPIRWDYYNSRKRIRNVFATFIKLKQLQPAFETEDFVMDVGGQMKRIELNHSDMDVRIIGNFGVEAGTMEANFSRTGSWYDYLSGEELNIEDVNRSFDLEPGEYHIFTTKLLITPELPSNTSGIEIFPDLMIYPNPVSDKLRVRAKNNISEIRITDVSGRTLLRKRIESNQAELEINSLKEGVYLIQILDNRDNYSVRKIIKH
jgi:hypothetical protein